MTWEIDLLAADAKGTKGTPERTRRHPDQIKPLITN